jgi:hypothetical protein
VIVITFLFYFFILFLVRYFICILPMYLGAPFDFNKFRYIYIYIIVPATFLLAHMGNRIKSFILLEIIDVYVTSHFLLSESMRLLE